VLSNIFCAFLIFTARPFRLGDYVEILDTAEKPGAKGEVVDISLLYITLQDSSEEHPGALLQIPNALVFQRIVRRWKGGPPPKAAASRPSVLAE
jgi:small-conductance mechanosensitive channel